MNLNPINEQSKAAEDSRFGFCSALARSSQHGTKQGVEVLKPSKPKVIALVIVAGASVAAPLLVYHNAQRKWREREQALEGQAQKCACLTEENQRLSDALTHKENLAGSREGVLEVMRLRGEIGRLRQTIKETTQRTDGTRTGAEDSSSKPQAPDPQTVQAFWSREQLGFAGQADPVSALQTVLWAMSRGDGPTLALSVSPRAKTKLARADWNEHGELAQEIAASAEKISESLSQASGFYLVGQKFASENEAVLDVFFEGEGKTRKFSMKKLEGEWKFSAMGRAGHDDDEIGDGVWP